MDSLKQTTLASISLTVLLLTSACAPIRATPFGEITETELFSINEQNKNRLPFTTSDLETEVRFALISDSHANYEDLERTVDRLNHEDVDFVMSLGDMTDLGLAFEYDVFLQMMSRLNKAWFSIIGNHDAIGSGKQIYQRHFGEYNNFFDHGGIRFVMFNNNRLDFLKEGIDWDWLEKVVNESSHPVVLFQHVNPWNKDYFDEASLDRLRKILDTNKVSVLFHGHQHKFSNQIYKNTLLQQVARTEGEQYALVSISNGQIEILNCQGGSCEKVSHTLTTF